jgi:ArsR family transcriptional regulator
MSKQELLPACRTPMVGEPLGPAAAEELARGFKALGDPVRLRLASMIAARAGGDVCVCELTTPFDVSGPTISHHLRVLREAGLITGQRRGTWIYYRIVPGRWADLSRMLEMAVLAGTTVAVSG